ncbi:L-arabinose ABC transporter, permease protein [Escherichia coli]|nr:L-arabinose ABC transporter, permease protein [Escherichia coli]
MQIVRGLAYIISDGKAVGIEDESFFALGYANWFGLPAPIWLTVACLVIFGLLLNKTTFGRNTLAIGGNEEAARLAGCTGCSHQNYYLCSLWPGISDSRNYSGFTYDQWAANDVDWL